MRLLLAIAIVAAVAWSAFWWVGARATDRDLSAWLDARHNAGWVANVGDISTSGYPNRYDTTLTELELVDTVGGLAWSAPFLQLFRLSYEPHHVIAVWPPQQSLAVPSERIGIATTDARGSFVFLPGQDWTLERANVTFEQLELTSDAGWTATVADGRLATRPSERIPGAVDLGLVLTDLKPASAPLVATSGFVPETIQQVSLDAAVTFDAAWDRQAIELGRPSITAIDLQLAKVNWGQAELWAAGDMTVDAQGKPTGNVTIKLTNWRELLDIARAGTLPERVADLTEDTLALLSGLAGSSETLDIPLRLSNGRAWLGPIPLGDITIFQPR